jgi:hypothetical protein
MTVVPHDIDHRARCSVIGIGAQLKKYTAMEWTPRFLGTYFIAHDNTKIWQARMSFGSKRVAALLFSSVLFFLLTACNPFKDYRLATKAAEDSHRRFDANQHQTIYNDADPTFRISMSQDIETKFFSRIKRKMGACQLGDLTGFNETTNMNGTVILAATKFSVRTVSWLRTSNFILLTEFRNSLSTTPRVRYCLLTETQPSVRVANLSELAGLMPISAITRTSLAGS